MNVSIAALATLALPVAAAAQTFDVMETTIPAVHSAMGPGRLNCRELVRAYLDRIAAYDKTLLCEARSILSSARS